jgi:hypothetical protein
MLFTKAVLTLMRELNHLNRFGVVAVIPVGWKRSIRGRVISHTQERADFVHLTHYYLI